MSSVAHVDDALHAEQRADGRGGHAVLAGAGLGDDAMLAHAPRQQRLSDAVVDLVRAGVQQVFALQVDLGAAKLFGQALGQEQGRGTAGVIGQQTVKLVAKAFVLARLGVSCFELLQRRHQRLGNVAAAIRAEASHGRARALRRGRWHVRR